MFITALKGSVIPAFVLVAVAGIGNTLGGLTGFWLGKFGRWEWLEKYFRIPRSKVESYQQFTFKYGYWLALLCWLPLIGDLLCVVLGFFRLKLLPVTILMLAGKVARYVVIALVMQTS